MLQALLVPLKLCSVSCKYSLNTIFFKAAFQVESFENQERLPWNVLFFSLILIGQVQIQNVLTSFVFRKESPNIAVFSLVQER